VCLNLLSGFLFGLVSGLVGVELSFFELLEHLVGLVYVDHLFLVLVVVDRIHHAGGHVLRVKQNAHRSLELGVKNFGLQLVSDCFLKQLLCFTIA
jgi:hypothetical protein